jgi:hypothetical protein
MPSNNQRWKPIKLSAKVFGHISQGLYRTPAGAIKELISNAFDADSPIVKIHTGFPRFDFFSCEDSGKGLSREEFDRLMEEGIGTSFKRNPVSELTPISKRNVIGRLGIGLLSIAQICTEFDLISHHQGSGKAFKVTLRFPPYTKQEIDKVAKGKKKTLIKGGEYKIVDVEYNPKASGVKIYTTHLRESFRKRMRNLERYGNYRKFKSHGPYKSFDSFLAAIYDDPDDVKSLSGVSEYDQLIFGLALAPPLPYFNHASNVMLQVPSFSEYQQRLEGNQFDLMVDNMSLRRPLKLPSNREKTKAADCDLTRTVSKEFELTDGSYQERVTVERHDFSVKNSDVKFSGYPVAYFNKNVGGRPLRFTGYLFQQTGRIYPREIQGVLVRIRDVAIGTYDAGFMNYPYQEGPRYSMVSCELIAEEGFEDALNIDRDSFNGLDSHYLRMQAYLYSLLHTVIFPETWREEKTRNKARKTSQKRDRRKDFLQIIKSSSGRGFVRVERVERPEESESPVEFEINKRTILVNVAHPLMHKILRRRKYEDLAEEIAIAFERVMTEGSVKKKRESFYDLLAGILNNQP